MIYYSPNGFPQTVKWSEDLGTYALSLFTDFVKNVDNQDFSLTLDIIEKAVRLEESVGDLFTLALEKDVKLSTNARSFILKYAGVLSKLPQVDRTPLDSWMLMLAPGDDVVYSAPNWTATERELLTKVSGYPVGRPKNFIKGPGLGKYFEFLRLRLMAV